MVSAEGATWTFFLTVSDQIQQMHPGIFQAAGLLLVRLTLVSQLSLSETDGGTM